MVFGSSPANAAICLVPPRPSKADRRPPTHRCCRSSRRANTSATCSDQSPLATAVVAVMTEPSMGRSMALKTCRSIIYGVFSGNRNYTLPKESARALIVRYASRHRVEDGLGISVNFFHIDCLASEVRLNVDLDTTMTVLANGCYRWLAKQLRGFDTAAPKQLYRKFVETAGVVDIQPERLVVHFDKRCHNPILREAALDQPSQVIPWLRNLPVVFQYP